MAALTQALLIVSVLVSLVLAVYGVRRRPRPGATAFATFSLGTLVFAAGVLGASVAETVDASMQWTRFMYVGLVSIPVAWFVLTVRYTGHDDLLTDRRIAGLVAFSVLSLVAMWTTESHQLFYTAVHPEPDHLPGFDVHHGPLYYTWVVVGYVLVLAGGGLLARMMYRRQDVYRKQAAALLLAFVAPFAANVAYQFELTGSDLTPVAFSVSGLALGWALHRYQFMDVTPVARKTIVENIDDGVLVVDDDDRIVDANPAARRLLDVPDGRTLVGRPGREALDEPFDDLLDRFPEPAGESRVETFVTDHGKRFLDVDVRPFADAGGHGNGRLFYLRDVTDREHRERELRRQNDQLDRFARLVSHDLRNPLNVAEGYVANAKATGDLDHLDEVEFAHERMRNIIDDVLALARQGQTVTDVEPVAVATVADRAWASVDTGDATLVVDADATVLADESRLRQLLENLFRNSVEHGSPCSPENPGNSVEHGSKSSRPEADDSVQHGGAGVTVTVDATEDAFYVADDGPGIPECERDLVLEDGYTTDEDGTGLGLSIVTSIADAHGWTVAVEESESGGARFAFSGTTPARDEPRTGVASD